MGFVGTNVTNPINFSLCGTVLVVTGLRLLSRKFVVPPMGLDDVYISIAALFGIAYVIVLHFEITAWETLNDAFISRPEPRNGVQTEFEWDYYSQAVLLTIFDNIFQLLALTFAKLSLIAFYRRISTAKRSHRIVLYVIEGVLYCNIFTTTVPLLFSTRPLKCYYDLNSFRGQCEWIINTTLLLSANSAVQIAVDVACFVLPWFVLWKLRISTANKVKVLTMYSFGIIAITFSALRIYAINRPNKNFLEYLEYQFQFMLWSVIEAFAPAICVSVPAIFGALFKLRTKHRSTHFSSKNKKQYLSEQNRSAASADKFGFDPYQDFGMSPMRPLHRLDSVSSSHYGGSSYHDEDYDNEKPDMHSRQYRLDSY